MRTEQRANTIYETIYITVDNREFSKKTDAEYHEKELNGSIKNCIRCCGKGEINGSYKTSYDPMCPTLQQYWWADKCPECNGKGYLEKTVEWK